MAKKVERKKLNILKHLNRILLLVVICLTCFIILKSNPTLKNTIYQKVFENNLNFAKINEIYQKHFGSSLPLMKKETIQTVSSVNLEYKNLKEYKDGVKLTVSEDYVISSISSGLVIFSGEKEGYGNTIIIQQPDDVEIWYGNVENPAINLYDYVKQGQSLGNALNNELYMAFFKEGKKLNYKKYI